MEHQESDEKTSVLIQDDIRAFYESQGIEFDKLESIEIPYRFIRLNRHFDLDETITRLKVGSHCEASKEWQ